MRRLAFEQLEDRRVLSAVPQLIDVNTKPAGSTPTGFTQLGDSIYFVANDFATGYELYRMPAPVGTPELAADLLPGRSSSGIGFGDVLNGRLIFTGAGKLWSVVEGGEPVLLGEFQTIYRSDLYTAIFASEFYFVADDGHSGVELWKTDGTPGSVAQVADLYPGINHGLPKYLTVFNGALYFAGRSPAGASQLWKIAAPGETPVSVDNIYPGSFSTDLLILGEFGGNLYLSAEDGVHGRKLWKTDGTLGGAELVKDIASGSSSSSPGTITVLLGVGYFAAQASTAQGYELWRTDGTAEGTWLVDDLTSVTNVSTLPRNLTVFHDRLYFAASDNFTGERLMSTDGTGEGTVEVKYIGRSQTNFGVRKITDLQVLNDQLVFQVDDRTDELWRSDGTTEGTKRLTEFVDGDDFGIGDLTAIGNLLYFSAGGSNAGPAPNSGPVTRRLPVQRCLLRSIRARWTPECAIW